MLRSEPKMLGISRFGVSGLGRYTTSLLGTLINETGNLNSVFYIYSERFCIKLLAINMENVKNHYFSREIKNVTIFKYKHYNNNNYLIYTLYIFNNIYYINTFIVDGKLKVVIINYYYYQPMKIKYI